MERHRRQDLYPPRNRTFYRVALGINYALAFGIFALVLASGRPKSPETYPTPTPTAELPTPTPARGTIIFNNLP